MDYKKLPKSLFAALIGIAALQPTPAGAANCIGAVVNWTLTSTTFCLGSFPASPSISSTSSGTKSNTVPPSNFRLKATLISGGIHGVALAYGFGSVPLSNCFPVDSTPGNGGVTAGIGNTDCLGGTQHQAVTVY